MYKLPSSMQIWHYCILVTLITWWNPTESRSQDFKKMAFMIAGHKNTEANLYSQYPANSILTSTFWFQSHYSWFAQTWIRIKLLRLGQWSPWIRRNVLYANPSHCHQASLCLHACVYSAAEVRGREPLPMQTQRGCFCEPPECDAKPCDCATMSNVTERHKHNQQGSAEFTSLAIW